ncbi:isoflavone reductase family protein [Dactylonectria estremocensis]|uniref:Isoflavone reductase family protein n=1 Tax=Dactylonectria estremocensis TaxID=1079267 RepID=A0A9P9DGR7_9HYPO|nr:isoflavone reductase family protein [Dactylonectria estremocensis]
MAASLKNVLLLGGAGTLGSPIIKALVANGTFTISVLSRPDSKSTFPTGLKRLTSDFTKPSLVESFKGQDAVVDLVAQASLDDCKRFIDAALEAGVKRFILSEFSGNMGNEANVSIAPLFSHRVAVREYARAKADAVPDFSFTTVSNGPFYDWAIKNGSIGFNLETHTATIYGDGNQPASVATLSSVGQAVAGILAKPAETANKSLFVASFTPTQNEILAVLEEVTGEKWEVNKIGIADSITQGFQALGKGDMSGFVGVFMGSTYGPGNGNDFPKSGGLSNELLGLPKEDMKAVTAAILEGKDV